MASTPFRDVVRDRFWLRAFIFLICIPSGGAVLTEVYGLVPMHDVVWYGAVPAYLILIGIWAFNRKGPLTEISDAIAIGAIGGFLGVVAYDIARIPFVVAGYRIFAQNSSYGVWILDADYSTRFSLVAGWIFHFANGTLFGVMYSIFMRGRHWGWAIVWAFLLETIALFSPYGNIYHITASVLLMVVAYYGHVAYALPLGFMTQRWEASARWLREVSPVYKIIALVALIAAIVGPMVAPGSIAADARAEKGVFVIEGDRLTPSWQRLRQVGSVTVRNSCDRDVVILLAGEPALSLARCQEGVLSIPTPGIHLVALPAEGLRTRSSFILVEPVSAAP